MAAAMAMRSSAQHWDLRPSIDDTGSAELAQRYRDTDLTTSGKVFAIRTGLSVTKPLVVFLIAGVLAACQTAQPGPGSLTVKSDKRALSAMEEISLAAGKCWFKSGNKDFRAYRMAPELNSYSGKPRLLIVPSSRPQDRPLAVIEAQAIRPPFRPMAR